MAEQRNASDMSEEAKASAELREKMRNVEKHLTSELGVDVSRSNDGAARRSGQGLRATSALEAANATKVVPFKDIHEVLRFEDRLDFARRGRQRVAPPLDHQPSQDAARRASLGRRGSSVGAGRRGSINNRRASRAATPPRTPASGRTTPPGRSPPRTPPNR